MKISTTFCKYWNIHTFCWTFHPLSSGEKNENWSGFGTVIAKFHLRPFWDTMNNDEGQRSRLYSIRYVIGWLCSQTEHVTRSCICGMWSLTWCSSLTLLLAVMNLTMSDDQHQLQQPGTLAPRQLKGGNSQFQFHSTRGRLSMQYMLNCFQKKAPVVF